MQCTIASECKTLKTLKGRTCAAAAPVFTWWRAAGVWAEAWTRTLCSTAPSQTAGCLFPSAPWRPAWTAAVRLPAESAISIQEEESKLIKMDTFLILKAFLWSLDGMKVMQSQEEDLIVSHRTVHFKVNHGSVWDQSCSVLVTDSFDLRVSLIFYFFFFLLQRSW